MSHQVPARPVSGISRPRASVTFRALRHRNYRLWFFGQGLSLVGTWMQSMAQQVLVYRLTGSAVSLGIVNFMVVLPLVPFALWGGSLSDRVSKRTIILVTQSLMMLQAVLLGMLAWTGTVQVWQIYGMAFVLGILKAVDMPARQAFVIELVEGKEDLTSAIGLNSAIHNGAKTLGPALAGVSIAMMGEAVAFLVNGFSFFAVIISLLLMRDLPHTAPREEGSPPVMRHTVEGIRYVISQQTILILMSLVAISSFLSRPYQTLMPVFADSMLKESGRGLVAVLCRGNFAWTNCQAPAAIPLGLLLSAVGAGAVLGAFLVASLPENAPRGRMLTLGNIAFPVFLLLFVRSDSIWVSTLIMLFVGISHVFQNSMANTLLQMTTPDPLRGRVMSLYSLVSHGMTHVGGLQAGLVADWVGAPISIGLGAAFSLLYGIFVAIRYPQVRDMG
ncbi:MAG: MFS transporter [Bacteroidota bacterium]